MSGRREAVATCTGERADSWTAPERQQTETVSQKRMPPDFSRNSGVLAGSRLRPGAPGACAGSWRLAAGGPPALGSGRIADRTLETAD